MTGLPTLLVELDDGTGTFPYNITPYVDMNAGWSLDRGRRDEFSDVDASIARLRLNNKDGRFTFGSSTYGIYVDQPVRITETFGGGTPSKRITGYVQEWPVEWDDPGGLYAPCSITLSDRQSRLTRRTLDNVFTSEQLRDAPAFLYMLGEEVGATSAGDTSGNGNRALTLKGQTPALAFGAPRLLENTAVQFNGTTGSTAAYLRGTLSQPRAIQSFGVSFSIATAPPVASTLAVLDNTSGTAAELQLLVTSSGFVQVRVIYAAGLSETTIEGTVSVVDGATHRATLTFDQATGTLRVYVDGATNGQPAIGATPLTFNRLTIGQDITASILGVAGFTSVLSQARHEAHFASQGTLISDSSDERVARLAGFGGLTSSELALEAGVLGSVDPQATNGASLWTSMTDVVKAEGGTLFIRGDGKLVMQNRTHRTLKASQTPAVALDSDEVDHSDLHIVADKQYLTNAARGSRSGGAEQKYRVAASVAKYDEYSQDFTGLLVTTDDEVLDRIVWQANAYCEVSPRLNTVSIDLLTLTSTAHVQSLLALELGDRITVASLPSATSPMTTADLIVEGISESQTHSTWRFTLNTVAADLFRAWVLGDATYGVLGSTTKLHY